ncbi:hypothetical protein Tcan_08766 [Toxocara canis]|uniref:Uncharacterized protein n=1 Tax=Toxocara canis TaxID=6265 RepID=A0A0B2V0H3_TOXCA|nr:hypothetical protein Tcan_08766 [Toxocara canis]
MTDHSLAQSEGTELQGHDGSTAETKTKSAARQTNNIPIESEQRSTQRHFVIRPLDNEITSVQVKRTLSATSSCTLERRQHIPRDIHVRMGPLWTKYDYVTYLET